MKKYAPGIAAVVLLLSALSSFGGISNEAPWFCGFESSEAPGYTNNMPLIDGVGGWYADSIDAIVQNAIISTNTSSVFPVNAQAAIIPIDVTLSNRFQNMLATNVWIQMDVRPVRDDGEDPPHVDTNASAMFFLSSNGYFAVQNSGTLGVTNWLELTNTVNGAAQVIPSNSWVRINIQQNYATKKWTLFANCQLLTNNIYFVNSTITNFSGFDLYNGGGETSFLDNISVTYTNPPDLGADGGNWLPDIGVSRTNLVGLIFTGNVATGQVFQAWKTNGFFGMVFTNAVGENWLQTTPSSFTNATEVQREIAVAFAESDALAAQTTPYETTITVSGRDDEFGFPATNSGHEIAVSLQVQELSVNPGALTSVVMKTHNAPQQQFDVVTLGAGTVGYGITSNVNWLSLNSSSGTLINQDTNTITITYSTAALNVGQWPGQLTIESPDGGGATKTVGLVMNVMDMKVSESAITGMVMRTLNAPNKTFGVISEGSGGFDYTITTNAGADWLAVDAGAGGLVNWATNDVTVSFTTAGLVAGTHTGVFTIATGDGGGATQTVEVVMNVIDLNVSPAALTNMVMSGLDAADQSFGVISEGSGGFDYTITTNAGADWLAVDAGAGSLVNWATNDVTVSFTTAGLVVGAHTGVFTIATGDGGGATQTVDVVMNVMSLAAAPGVLTNFTMRGVSPSNQAFDVVSAGAGAINYTITTNAGADWLSVDSGAGTLDGSETNTITVSYNTVALEGGTHTGVFTVATGDGGGATQEVSVVMQVDAVPVLEWSAAGWTNSITEGDSLASVTFEIWNDSADPKRIMSYELSGDMAWASLSASSGTSTGERHTVTLSFDTAALVAGEYVGSVRAVATDQETGDSAVNSPAEAGVKLTVVAGIPEVPTGLEASEGLRGAVYLTWLPAEGALSYEIWRNTAEDSSSATKLSGVSGTEYADSVVTPGTRYYYWVKAANGEWKSDFSSSAVGWARAVEGDFDGDGKADPWYYYDNMGQWYLMMSELGATNMQFGSSSMTPIPADFDGDGKADVAVYDEATGYWYVSLSGSGELSVLKFGEPGYTEASADFDGDGKTDVAVYHEDSGYWFVFLSTTSQMAYQKFGAPGYLPVPADYDGDEKADLAVYSESTGFWFILPSSSYVMAYLQFGGSGFVPVPGDYVGDGLADMAVYDRVTGTWHILTWNYEYLMVQFGWSEAEPAPADYDGDGIVDPAVFYRSRTDSTWYLLKSSEGYEMISGRSMRPGAE